MAEWEPDTNQNLYGIMSYAQQANILCIMKELYSIDGWICSVTAGRSMRFINFRDCECPICRVPHGNTWALANHTGSSYLEVRYTLVICHKTGKRARIDIALPF